MASGGLSGKEQFTQLMAAISGVAAGINARLDPIQATWVEWQNLVESQREDRARTELTWAEIRAEQNEAREKTDAQVENIRTEQAVLSQSLAALSAVVKANQREGGQGDDWRALHQFAEGKGKMIQREDGVRSEARCDDSPFTSSKVKTVRLSIDGSSEGRGGQARVAVEGSSEVRGSPATVPDGGAMGPRGCQLGISDLGGGEAWPVRSSLSERSHRRKDGAGDWPVRPRCNTSEKFSCRDRNKPEGNRQTGKRERRAGQNGIFDV